MSTTVGAGLIAALLFSGASSLAIREVQASSIGVSVPIVAAIIQAPSPGTGTSTASTQAAPAGDDPAGAFATSVCAACHGARREGGIGGPPLTAQALAGKDPADLARSITDGIGAMPPFGATLTPEDVNTFVTWLQTPVDNPTPTAPSQSAPAGSDPAAAFATSVCAACHGSSREGGIGPALTSQALSGKNPADLARRITDGVGAMPPFGATLTPDDVNTFVAWLQAAS